MYAVRYAFHAHHTFAVMFTAIWHQHLESYIAFNSSRRCSVNTKFETCCRNFIWRLHNGNSEQKRLDLE